LTGVAQTAFEIGLLTEDNLPSYHRLIHGMFGQGDGAWINWVGRWTAEEGRHAIVLRDYLTVTRNIDPIALERGRMTQLQEGYDHDAPGLLRGLAYVAFQELATRISHRNTGRYSDDPVADKIMVRIAADENLHPALEDLRAHRARRRRGGGPKETRGASVESPTHGLFSSIRTSALDREISQTLHETDAEVRLGGGSSDPIRRPTRS